jgi:hypothetical protein
MKGMKGKVREGEGERGKKTVQRCELSARCFVTWFGE